MRTRHEAVRCESENIIRRQVQRFDLILCRAPSEKEVSFRVRLQRFRNT